MRINTAKFGVIDIEDEKILSFHHGILGFEHLKRFTLLKIEETLPFYWLQALDDEDIALPCMNPFDFIPAYKPLVDEAVLKNLGDTKNGDLIVLTTVAVPGEPAKATTNLAAPIIINTVTNKGLQFVLQNADYDLRHPVFLKKEDAQHADSVQKAK